MRILFLAHRVPYPPNKGDKIRAFHEIRGLAERGHEVSLVTFADDPRDLAHGPALRRWCASVDIVPLDRRIAGVRALLALVGRGSLSVAFYSLAAMRLSVAARAAASRPDAVVVYCSTMAQYVPPGFERRTVVDLVDVDSEKWRDYSRSSIWPKSRLYAAEAERLRRYERWVLGTFAHTVVTTPREAAILCPSYAPPLYVGRGFSPADQGFSPADQDSDRADQDVGRGFSPAGQHPASAGPSRCSLTLHALVNGVDLDHFRPGPPPDPASLPPGERRYFGGAGPRVVFTGAMDYHANVDAVVAFADRDWPRVREAHPGARFLVVGSNPAPAVRAIASRPGIEVTGFVEDVRPYLLSADICVVPLRIARGVQNKALEALACGRPVVASAEAAAGLAARDGVEIVVVPASVPFAEAVNLLLDDGPRAAAVGAAGRRFVEREHAWPRMLDRFAALVEAAAGAGT